MDSSTIVIISEILLSLYPQLIKLVPLGIDIQVGVRMITYVILAVVTGIIYFRDWRLVFDFKGMSSLVILVLGLVNIVHIWSSYISFKYLPSGVGFSLFYLYPIFNILARQIFYSENVSMLNYVYMIVAVGGVYMVSLNKDRNSSIDEENALATKFESWIIENMGVSRETFGTVAGICSALTESVIYLVVKSGSTVVSPFVQIIKTYLLGSIVYGGWIISNVDKLSGVRWEYWVGLVLFNAVAGYLGYLLRFFLIPRTGSLVFNSLMYVGVIFAYIWGYLLSGEIVGMKEIVGSIMILGSVLMINRK